MNEEERKVLLSENSIQQSERKRDDGANDGTGSETAAAEQQRSAQSGAADNGSYDCLGDLHICVSFRRLERRSSLPSLKSVSHLLPFDNTKLKLSI